jgi:hypothetical protein
MKKQFFYLFFLFSFLIFSASAIAEDLNTVYLNETHVNLEDTEEVSNNTYIIIAGGGEPLWNENFTLYNATWSSMTNTSYYLITNPYSFWNSTWAEFNKTYADTLYSPINEPLWADNFTKYNASWSNMTNASYALVSEPLWTDNFTKYNSSWSSITNTSYYLVTNPFGFYNSTTLSTAETDPKWTDNFTKYNSSWSSITNTSYMTWPQIANGTIWSWVANGTMASWAQVSNGTMAKWSQVTNGTMASWTQAMNGTLMSQATYNANYSHLVYNDQANVINEAGAILDQRIETDTDAYALFVDGDTDKVGIGTGTPQGKLDVVGRLNTVSTTYGFSHYNGTPSSAANQYLISLYSTNNFLLSTGKNGASVTQPSFSLGTADTARITIDNSGNVGINTTTPADALSVNGNINLGNSNKIKFGGEDFITLYADSITMGKNATPDVTADHGVYIGNYAGQNSIGDHSTAVGYYAGWNSTNNDMAAFGDSAGQQNAGIQATLIGYQAGRENLANNVVFLGNVAGYQNSGEYAMGLGDHAGWLNTGNYSTGIGYRSIKSNTGNNVVAIGYDAGKDNTLSDQFILKQTNVNAVPLIQGNFSSRYIGFGTTAPATYLDINGTQKAGSYGISATAININMTNDASSVYGGIAWKDTTSGLDEQGGIYSMYSANINYLDFTMNKILYMRIMNGTGVVFNDNSADQDFRIESDGNANMFFVDGGANCVTAGYNGCLGATLNTYNGTANTVQFTGKQMNVRGGGGETNSVSEITLGIGSYTNPVTVIGSKVIDGTGNTKSNFYVGTRDVTTDTLPTERFRIDTTGLTNALYSLNVTGMVQINANTTAITCNAANAGSIYYNGGTSKHYGCNSTTWNALY